MKEIDSVIDDIKGIECPVDKVQERIADACEGYKNIGKTDVIVDRDKGLDRDELMGYAVYTSDGSIPKITAYVEEGLDHYVAKVVEAYISY